MLLWKKNKKAKSITDCIDCEKGKPFLIIGAGGTLKQYADPIKAFMEKHKPITIGINKMTDFHIPDYHLWTNKQRWEDFGSCVSEKSKLMFAADFKKKIIRKHFKGDYILVDYVDKAGVETGYKNGMVYGHFRTAGCLSILLCHLFGAKYIYIAGMDGYTLHGREELEQGNQSQHLYGAGFTDNASWQECLEKDQQVSDAMSQIEAFGVKFKIITPTKFEKYYAPDILQEFITARI